MLRKRESKVSFFDTDMISYHEHLLYVDFQSKSFVTLITFDFIRILNPKMKQKYFYEIGKIYLYNLKKIFDDNLVVD